MDAPKIHLNLVIDLIRLHIKSLLLSETKVYLAQHFVVDLSGFDSMKDGQGCHMPALDNLRYKKVR